MKRARWTVTVWVETDSTLQPEDIAREVKRLYREHSHRSRLDLLTVYTPRIDSIREEGADAERDAV